MSSPSQIASSINSLNLNTTAGGFAKTSSNIDFGSRLKKGMAQGASLTYQSVAPMAPFVPGGAVMSAMLHSTASTLATDGGLGGSSIGGVPGMMSAGGLPSAGGLTGDHANMTQSVEQLQQSMMSNNLYMLGLQQEFNNMNQKYTAVSNILKTKHDTEKNAIQNFR